MLDDAQPRCFKMEKKAKNFDKIIIEWKNKIDSLEAELDQTHVECRSYSAQLFKVQTVYEESQQQLDVVRRENKNLSNAIKDIMMLTESKMAEVRAKKAMIDAARLAYEHADHIR